MDSLPKEDSTQEGIFNIESRLKTEVQRRN